jgi:hypothetical protein
MWVIGRLYLGSQKSLYAYLGSSFPNSIFRIPLVATTLFLGFLESAPDRRV